MQTEQQIIASERKSLVDLLDIVPLRSVDENVLIASWNIAQFSDKKKSALCNTSLIFVSDSILWPYKK